jgi:RNA polymerase sigma-70 factor, ECF subfamily
MRVLRQSQSASNATPDNDLVALVVTGELSAFEVLMRRHNRMLFRAARAILKDDAEAEDALQNAYLAAYQALPRFRGESRFSTWLARIAINESLGRRRKRAAENRVIPLEDAADTEGELDLPAESSPPPAPELSAMRTEARALIERKIDALPEQFRVVFVLRAVEELSVEDTASCLGIPEATVRTRFFRARSLLRESLAREVDHALGEAFSFAGSRCDRIVNTVLASLRSP